MVERRVGNRYTGGTRLTNREAVRVAKMILTLEKLANKKSRYIGEVRELRYAARTLRNVLEDADRNYVLKL